MVEHNQLHETQYEDIKYPTFRWEKKTVQDGEMKT